VIAESAKVDRCPPALVSRETGGDPKRLAACHPAAGGWLMALVEGNGVRLRSLGPEGRRWERVFEGTVVFQEGLVLITQTAAGHRATWLSASDGTTLRTLEFVQQQGPTPAVVKSCGDRVLSWFKAGEVIAAICLVLD
jgi:hypothetical protein